MTTHTRTAGCNLSGLPFDLFSDPPCAACEAETQARARAAAAYNALRARVAAAIVAALTPTERDSLGSGRLALRGIDEDAERLCSLE